MCTDNEKCDDEKRLRVIDEIDSSNFPSSNSLINDPERDE